MKNDIERLKRIIDNKEDFFFDLDGTLIDTEKLYFKFWKEASKFYGYELKDEEALSMRSLEEKSAIELFDKYSNGVLDYKITKLKRIELMNEYFINHPIEIKEGAKEFLLLLKKKNKKIYIVTANAIEKANKIIGEIGFINLIDGVISAKNVNRGKPYPDVYLYAVKKTNTNSNEAIVFEDSPNGLLSSSRAGLYTVMIEDMSKYDESMDYVDSYISSFIDLI